MCNILKYYSKIHYETKFVHYFANFVFPISYTWFADFRSESLSLSKNIFKFFCSTRLSPAYKHSSVYATCLVPKYLANNNKKKPLLSGK